MPASSYKGDQRTLYLSPELNARITAYLREHPELFFSGWVRSLIYEALTSTRELKASE